ncbi:hypothetical protein GCM10010503_57160 [Streptomyces lucensis JCM 4490]|uniref:Uncharacterized protein n=1 Tax=Streptomyces lucensis JCM 4490 TaxID=1306176 RepID=A0A918JBB0_9ACTN|nr:hypothetical protein GCM10010503_57160 [Streptomyces lucensis JCM 4490]
MECEADGPVSGYRVTCGGRRKPRARPPAGAPPVTRSPGFRSVTRPGVRVPRMGSGRARYGGARAVMAEEGTTPTPLPRRRTAGRTGAPPDSPTARQPDSPTEPPYRCPGVPPSDRPAVVEESLPCVAPSAPCPPPSPPVLR